MNPQIVVVGSLNLDLVARVKRLPVPGETVTSLDFDCFCGGKGANQAYAAARLGGCVAMIGRVGADAYADELTQNLFAVGVDVSAVKRDSHASSGIAMISIDTEAQNHIIIVPGANGMFTAKHLNESREVLAAAGGVLLQLEIPIETTLAAARIAKQRGAFVILDPAPAQKVPAELLTLADYLTPNETELALLTGNSIVENENLNENLSAARIMASALHRRGAHKIIVKMGALGALMVAEDGREQFWEAVPVNAVDTTAAGDCFNAAFAVALVEGRTETEAGRFAVAAAACCVTRKGAQASMPARDEVNELVSQQFGG